MKEPNPMPDAVIDSVCRWAGICSEQCSECQSTDDKAHVQKAYETLRALRWNFDHYYFTLGTMYVGIELDGYMHT